MSCQHLVFEQLQRIAQCLLQAIYSDFCFVQPHRSPRIGREVVQLSLVLLSGQFCRSEVVQHITGEREFGILVTTLADDKVELCQFILFVLTVNQFNAVVQRADTQVFLKIQVLRFLALGFHCEKVGAELRLRVTVHLNRRDLRFFHLRRVGIFVTLHFVDTDIIIAQIDVRHADYVFLRQLVQAVETMHVIFVRNLIDEGINHRISTITIDLLADEFIALQIADDSFEQFVGELSFLDFVHFCEQQFAHILQTLVLFGATVDIIGAEIISAIVVVLRAKQRLFLHDVDV